MPKTMPLVDDSGTTTGWMILCPACECCHLFNIKPDNPNGLGGIQPTWSFNGDQEKPTFRASMLVNRGGHDPARPVCHSFVTDGKIEFCGDSTHAMAGKTVELQDFETLGKKNDD